MLNMLNIHLLVCICLICVLVEIMTRGPLIMVAPYHDHYNFIMSSKSGGHNDRYLLLCIFMYESLTLKWKRFKISNFICTTVIFKGCPVLDLKPNRKWSNITILWLHFLLGFKSNIVEYFCSKKMRMFITSKNKYYEITWKYVKHIPFLLI